MTTVHAPRSDEPTQAGLAPDPAAFDAPSRLAGRTLLAFGLAALLLVVVPLALARLVGANEGVEHVFVIPAGTAARITAGEQVDVIPADLHVRLDDVLVVINNDSRTHRVGPFTVDPGERLRERFGRATTLSGFCSLHPNDRIEIDVRPKS